MADNVYVLGVGMIKFGRYPDKKVEELGGEAALLALDDAGMTIHDAQALYSGNLLRANDTIGQRILGQIGQTGIPVVNVANACATGATAFREAYAAVKAGMVDIALVVGSEQMGKGLLGAPSQTGIPTEGLLGSGLMPAIFAESGTAYMAEYGATFEDFALVSVKNHEHSMKNPLAMYRMETPLEQVMGAEMIAYPNTKLMCSVNVDGAAAAVLVSEKIARQRGLGRAVRVAASALRSDRFTDRNLTMPDVNTCTREAAESAYEQAGVGPKDLDLVELHDCFATAELLHYENLGLCGKGEARKLLRDRVTWAGGKTPVNLSGGLLSKGHPLGATGVANIYEIVTHLRGEAGERQRQGARVGLTHVVGLGTCAAVHILEKARG
jgi:acetyl-CoA acyltransferase